MSQPGVTRQCTTQAAITRNISYSYLVSTQASDWSTLVRDVHLPPIPRHSAVGRAVSCTLLPEVSQFLPEPVTQRSDLQSLVY